MAEQETGAVMVANTAADILALLREEAEDTSWQQESAERFVPILQPERQAEFNRLALRLPAALRNQVYFACGTLMTNVPGKVRPTAIPPSKTKILAEAIGKLEAEVAELRAVAGLDKEDGGESE